MLRPDAPRLAAAAAPPATGAGLPPGARLAGLPRLPVLGVGSLGRAVPTPGCDRLDRQGHPIYTASGRVSILLALRALGLGPGKKVLLPSYHCPTMVEPCLLLGGEPVFYPIDANGRPDEDFLRRVPVRDVVALLAAHLFGLPIDMRGLRGLCDERGLALIEDCAHAFFGRSAAGPVGTQGDFAVGSLTKFFPVVEGGCLLVRAGHPAARGIELGPAGALRALRCVWDAVEVGAATRRLGAFDGMARGLVSLKRRLRGGEPAPAAAPSAAPVDVAGAFKTIDARRAKLGATAATRWIVRHADEARIVSRRRDNYRRLVQAFSGQAGLRPLFPMLPADAVPYVFPLHVDDARRIHPVLRALGMPMFRWDLRWPATPDDPVGSDWSTHVFQLACHQDLEPQDLELMASTVVAVAEGRVPA